ncbi:MAG: single-stranded DNA-binding protein [Planctomycetes bacterium]|nr:single-stranded DNA-binding protein [Planctomycetota bacterium]
MADARAVIAAAQRLRDELPPTPLPPLVSHVYNPLGYAWPMHEAYLRRYAAGRKRVVFLGMNPGPYGMAQTGVPFGEIAVVRDWLGLDAAIGRPDPEHPRRPVTGLDCARSEVSGRRLWGLFRERFASAEAFATEHFVANYCPLVFMSASGGNVTPDKLPPTARKTIEAACDRHLVALVDALRPEWLVGIGAFAAQRAERALAGRARIGQILHPSPASPAANRGWAEQAQRGMVGLGIWPA